MYTYYISVGSNIGDRRQFIDGAYDSLSYILRFIGLLVPPLWRQNLGAIQNKMCF